ncbi:hypothetical protein ACFSYH_13485 [Populibacterium corticicola]|uniref:Uncharacterized protein n=1 Tax=Populibacterium corticicola TaxID=1812826 RepID=A0ABW5XJ38_9MICO
MEFALGAVGLGVVAFAVVWAMALTRKVRKAGANYAPVRQETPGQRLAWCALIIIGITGIALLTVLSPTLISEHSGGYSSLRTAVTGLLDGPCCEQGSQDATAGQRIFAVLQSFGVIALAGWLSWRVVRRGQHIVSTAIAEHEETQK